MNTNPQVGADASDPKSNLARRRVAGRAVRPPGWAAGLVTAGTICIALLLSACSGTPSATTSDTSPPPASASSSTSESGSPKSAWVRGTHVVVTNATGSPVRIGQYPNAALSLPPGESITYSEPYHQATDTVVSFQVLYNPPGAPANITAQIEIKNPVWGYPEAFVDYTPKAAKDADKDVWGWDWPYSEGESSTWKQATRVITFNRLTDDDSNKNWTVTIGK